MIVSERKHVLRNCEIKIQKERSYVVHVDMFSIEAIDNFESCDKC
jgi:hypothetical protein